MSDDNQSDNNDDDLQADVEAAISNPDGAKDGLADKAKDALGGVGDKIPGGGKGAAAAAGAAGVVGGLKGKASDLLGGGADAGSGLSESLKDKAAAAKQSVTGAAGAAADKVDGPDGGGKASSLKERAAAAKANMTDAAGSMKDKAAGAAGSAKDAASGAAGSAKDAAAGAGDAAKGAASGATGSVKGAAAGAAAGVTGAAAAASDKASSTVSATTSTTTTTTTSTTSVSGGGNAGGTTGGGGSGGGSGSGGSSGGGRPNDDDDEGGFFSGGPIPGEWQVIGLGLLVAGFFFLGPAIWGYFTGDDAAIEETAGALDEATDDRCETVLDELRASDLDEEDYEGLRCVIKGDDVVIEGDVESETIRKDVGAVIAGTALVGAADAIPRLEIPEEEEVEEVAAEATTTTAAPTTTEAPTTTAAPTTTEAPTTTTEAPTTTAAPEPYTMWQALNETGQNVQFATIAGGLGLQDALEDMEAGQRTLFAPSDAAMGALDPAVIGGLIEDPEAANALVGYHFLSGAVTAEDLIALDGQSVDSVTGLPIAVTVVDGQVVLNGTTTVVDTDYTADNGIVHVIEPLLTPPSVNQAAGIENIEFEVNSAVITAAGQVEVQKAVAFFTDRPDATASIEGHTDTDGGADANLALSQARADAVKQFLVDAGLDGERFTTAGFGETQPIVVDGAEDKAASRRIEFKLQ